MIARSHIRLAAFVALVAAISLAPGCGKQEMEGTQRDAITKYLANKEPGYYEQGGAYIRVMNGDRAEYPIENVVEWGDSLWMYFAGYIFTTQPVAPPFYTNDSLYIKADTIINKQYWSLLDRTYWSFDPLAIKLGTTPLVEGLLRALPGCREHDVLEVYMPSVLGFDRAQVGGVPAGSALMYQLYIDKVKR